MSKTFYLFSNLGTPAAPTADAVSSYLKEFLTDPLVIPLPTPLRWLLVHGWIAPRRAPHSAKKYAAIWSAEGSPLLVHSQSLLALVNKHLSGRALLGMRYGSPSLASALEEAMEKKAERLVLVPLYPQFAEATSGSTTKYFRELCRKRGFRGQVEVFSAFPTAPFFVQPMAKLIAPLLAPDSHLLLTFHGLPESQLTLSGAGCLKSADCCERALPELNCYRAHCLASAKKIAQELGLPPHRWTLAFQSRFGRARWIGPHTEDLLRSLPAAGKKKLVVAAPSFVADCLETLEELGIQGREIFLGAGGEQFTLAPCLNGDPTFAQGIAEKLRETN